jgi:hypothetical protein
MRKTTAWCALALAGVGLTACSSSSKSKGATSDSGVPDTGGSEKDGGGSNEGGGPTDGGPPTEGGITGDAGTNSTLLVAYGTSTSELFAVNIAGKSLSGTLDFPGAFGAPFDQTAAPWLLEQDVDVVARLDATQPWVVDSSWNVALSDATDAGSSYSDPYAVVVSSPNAAYVLRYTRNEIAVINPSQNVDGGAPTSTIDLSSLVQAADGDGAVEMTAGVYVASSQLLYVVLGNIDRNDVVNEGVNLLCVPTVSTVIAIDTTTNTIKSLGGTGPQGSVVLSGYDPVAGGVVYDPANNRLLIAESGCNPLGEAGMGGADSGTPVGPIQKRGVEAVSLATNTTQILHDGSMDGVPSSFVYIDATHAVLGFDYTGSETVQWNPTMSALGAAIPNAPDLFVYDGVANLVGVLTTSAGDGGSTTNVISAPIAGGAATTILSNPFMAAGCGSYCVGGLALWPQP